MSHLTSENLDTRKRELLLKELDERHQYSRFIAQAYLAWYTFFVTLNLAIMGVSLAHPTEIARYQGPMAGSFLLFNIIGVLAIWVIFRGTWNQRSRIAEIIGALDGPPVQKSVPEGSADKKPPPHFFRKICNFFFEIYHVLESLSRKHKPKEKIEVISPYPHYLFELISSIFAASHFVLMGFWGVFLIYGF